MSMLPIIKLPHPNGGGKCYPLSVFESIVNTKPIHCVNNIGGYKPGDTINAETDYDTVFRKIMEEPQDNSIVTNFDVVSDETVPSSKLTKESLVSLSVDINGKENVGVAAALVDDLKNGQVKTNTDNITSNTSAINTIQGNEDIIGSIKYEVNILRTNEVETNTTNIEDLQKNKQDKLVWASVEYDKVSNPAVTAADLNSTTQEIISTFPKVITLRGIYHKEGEETPLETLARCVENPKNGDFAIVDDTEFIYTSENASWNELTGNVNNYIRRGTIHSSDFPRECMISQDNIIGLRDLSTDVNSIKNETVPELQNDIEGLNESVAKHETSISNTYNKTEVNTNITNAIADCNTYTNTSIDTLKFTNTDEADLTNNEGVISAIKNILIKLGMKEENIKTN